MLMKLFFNLFTGIPALMIQDMMRNLAACSGFSHVALSLCIESLRKALSTI